MLMMNISAMLTNGLMVFQNFIFETPILSTVYYVCPGEAD